MPTRYLAFDIETAKEVPGEDFNWRPHRPLGIACAATLTSDGEPRLWHGAATQGRPAPRMSQVDARQFVDYLARMSAEGYTILSWNGLGFDFDILAEESAARSECEKVALKHVDMMFHIVCELGYPVSLDKAAQGLGVPGKPAGMTGLRAPILWGQGKFQEVLDYVAQDVRTTLAVALAAERRKKFEWITRKGTKSALPLSRGWLPVEKALELPEPDTSWMSSPIRRAEFMPWICRFGSP